MMILMKLVCVSHKKIDELLHLLICYVRFHRLGANAMIGDGHVRELQWEPVSLRCAGVGPPQPLPGPLAHASDKLPRSSPLRHIVC